MRTFFNIEIEQPDGRSRSLHKRHLGSYAEAYVELEKSRLEQSERKFTLIRFGTTLEEVNV